MSDRFELTKLFWSCFPRVTKENAWQWCEKHLRLIGSARSEKFSIETTPWLKEPFERLNDGITKCEVVVGPAQSGKSALGEGAQCFWIATEPNGDIQYNWEDDEKAKERFVTRAKKIMQACKPIAALWPTSRQEDKACQIIFPHMNFVMQGTRVKSNLESASIRFQINEEVHDWEAGRLRLADKRQSAYWNRFQLNLSTGGVRGDQLHQRWMDSTQQHWMEKCPECGKYQVFHVRKIHGQRGGLCYDLDGARNEDGTIDYAKLEESIYYECEHCGHHMLDKLEERRRRSLEGKYSEAATKNPIRGYHWEQVSVYWVKWIDIIREKIEAYSAMRRGDISQWIFYLQRVEAAFWDPEVRPYSEFVKLKDGVKIGEGLETRQFRAMTVDFQAGSQHQGIEPHFKVVIRDWNPDMSSQLVYACAILPGRKLEPLGDDPVSDIGAALDALREKFEVDSNRVLIDSGYNASYIYQICYRYGYLAIKGSSSNNQFKYQLYDRDGKPLPSVYRVYSNLQPVDPFVGDHDGREGKYQVHLMFYSKQGIRDILDLIRKQHEWIVPEDASEEYKKEITSEELQTFKDRRTGEDVRMWCKVSHRAKNDYFVCEAYQALLVTMMIDAGILIVSDELRPIERKAISTDHLSRKIADDS